MIRRQHLLTAATAIMAAVSVSSCSSAPALPSDDGGMYQELTGADGQEFLRDISEYDWDDGGRAIAARFDWINNSARSTDHAAAERAGESAVAIGTFLSADQEALSRVSTGWFGLEHRTVGEVNPDLVRAYSSALSPYQGALVGDGNGIQGFHPGRDLLVARNIYAVIDTSTDAGNAFRDRAYERVRQYLRAYGRAVASPEPADMVALRYAAELAGAVAGGQRMSGNDAIHTTSSQSWINWAGYEVAAARDVQPGDPDVPSRFFAADGRLLSPDELANEDLDSFSTAVENYAFHHGASNTGNDFDRWYEDAAGK